MGNDNFAKAEHLLNFTFATKWSGNHTLNLISAPLKQVLNLNVKKLENIAERLGISEFISTNDNLSSTVILKFKESLQGGSYSFTIQELRILCFNLGVSIEGLTNSIYESPNELDKLFLLLDSKWRESFIIGLFYCLLKEWGSKSSLSQSKLEKYLGDKIKSYGGNRKSIQAIIQNFKYFKNPNGLKLILSQINTESIIIKDLPKWLSLPEQYFTFDYFSSVIIFYYESNSSDPFRIVDELERTLITHNNVKINQIVLSNLIIKVNDPLYASIQTKIKDLAYQLIGDPENTHKWIPYEGVTDEQKFTIQNARIILNEWITKQFINIFFKVCINDERRKKFWLRYASKISSFKVYGSGGIKDLLSRDERIVKYLDSRFKIVHSNSSNSAFVLFTNNYALIEFSNAGNAFYAYQLNSKNCPLSNTRLNRNYAIQSVDDLKKTDLPLLLTRSGKSVSNIKAEGRLIHLDGDIVWERFFDYWLKNIAKIDV